VALIAVCTLIPEFSRAQSKVVTEADKIKQAQKAFDNKEYAKALPLYSQIVSNQPENALFNYCLGVCLLKVDGDKADAVRFFTIATKSTDVPMNCWLYFGMALHQAYRFDEAIVALQNFRKNAGKQEWKDSGGEQLLMMCQNSINLSNDLSLSRHSILKEQETNCIDFVANYKNIISVGKFLKLPKEYENKATKDNPGCAMLFLSARGDIMVYAGPGTTGETGLDIYKVNKDVRGLWMFPEPLSAVINTPGDEAYPVLANNGNTLYFSSNGNKSTGGYDVFRSDFNRTDGTWSEPVPMGTPVNSPGDDFYYVPMSETKTAYFSSERESPSGKCKVYTASILDEDRAFVAINGTFVCPAGLELSDAKVNILNSGDRSLLAQFRTSTQNGTFLLKLPLPAKLIYQVKLPGFNELESEVILTDAGQVKMLQEILVQRDPKGKETLLITTKVPEAMPEMVARKATISTDGPQMVAQYKSVDPASQTMAQRDPVMADRNAVATTQTAPTVAAKKTPPATVETTPVAKVNTGSKPESTSAKAQTETPATADKKTSETNTETTTASISANTKTTTPAIAEKKNTTTNTEAPPVAVVNTETKTATTSAKAKTETQVSAVHKATSTTTAAPLVAVVNTEAMPETTSAKAATPANSDNKTASTTTDAPLVSVINTEAKPETTAAKAKTATPANSDNKTASTTTDAPLVSVSNTEAMPETTSAKAKTATPANSDNKTASTTTDAPLVSVVNTEAMPETSSAKAKTSTPANSDNKTASTTTAAPLVSVESTDAMPETTSAKAKGKKPVNSNSKTTEMTTDDFLASEENTEEKPETTSLKTETPAITDNKATATDFPLISVVNTEAMQETALAKAKASTPAVAENKSAATTTNTQLVSVVNTEAMPETTSAKVKTETSVNSENKSSSTTTAPLVSVVNTEAKPETTSAKANEAMPVISNNKTAASTSETPSATVVNSETKAETTSAKANEAMPVISNNKTATSTTETPSATVVNTDTKAVTTSAKSNEAMPVISNNKTTASTTEAPLTTVVNTESKPETTSAKAKVDTPVTTSSDATTASDEATEGKRKSKKSKQEEPMPVMVQAPVETVATTQERPELKNVIFKVQLGAFKNRTEAELKKKFETTGITNLEYIRNSEGLLVVVMGHEGDYASATKLKETVIEKGLKDAFVVVYSGEDRLPVSMVVFDEE